MAEGLRILPFSDERAQDFHDINAAWIEAMFTLEPTDREVLEHPRERIVAPGGDILFIATADGAVVGAGALQRTAPGQFELTKMGIRETARGLKAGEFLLRALIARAEELEAQRLYLPTENAPPRSISTKRRGSFTTPKSWPSSAGAMPVPTLR